MARIREGTVIGEKYRIERPLARGGMGAIYVARHLGLDMPVAVKFLDANFACTPDGRSRFEREAKAVALAQSPNIIHVHDYGIHEELPYMAMELLKGEDLGARIRREGRLPLPAVVDIVMQVCKALRKAHEAGIIHRDLKPANIFLARDDDEQIVKVLDFGVAKMTGVGAAGEATHTGVVVGSVHYMSPEQARGHKDIDSRSDLWSLGVIAYRALTGQLPFPGEQMGDVIVKICTDPFPPVSSLRPDLGLEVDAFFARALAKTPDERFQNARELAQAFAALPGAAGEVSTAGAAYRMSLPSGVSSIGGPTPVPASSSGTPMAMGPPLSDPPATPSAVPLYPPPQAAGTLTTSSQVSDVSVGARPHSASKRTVALIGLAGAAVLGIGGVLAFGRGGGEARTAASVTPSAVAPVAATSAAVVASTTASVAPSATASVAATASAAPSASATAKAAAAKTASPRPGGPPRINSELGF